MKDKLLIGELILESIEQKFNIKIIREEKRYPEEFYIGDFVINGHGQAGFINDTFNLKNDIKVNISDFTITSITGVTGYETLEINNYHAFKINQL